MVDPKIHKPPLPSTPRLAPWDHVEELVQRLDRLIALLEGAAPAAPAPPPEWPGWEPITRKLDEMIAIMAGATPAPPPEWPGWEPVITQLEAIRTTLESISIGAAPWIAKEPEEIFKRDIRTVTTVYSDKMANWTKGKRMLLKVDSSLDQAVQIQVIGNTEAGVNGSVNINSALPCVANGRITVGLAWDDWHPYIGATITTAIAPTAGTLRIWAVIQE